MIELILTHTNLEKTLRQNELKNVKCLDGSECVDGQTCCVMGNNKEGCCPLSNAVCCSDKKHCCPEGHFCQGGGTCTTLTDQVHPLVKLISNGHDKL